MKAESGKCVIKAPFCKELFEEMKRRETTCCDTPYQQAFTLGMYYMLEFLCIDDQYEKFKKESK
jgi:hypothetical protein